LLLGVVLGAVLTGGLLWWSFSPSADGMSGASGTAAGGPPGGPGAAAPPVDATAAVETIAAEQVQLLGTARPVRQSSVASEVDGLTAELFVDEGDAVQEGQILVRLRTAAVEQQLAAAGAARDETEARLARASADFDRLSSLRDRQAISAREYDQALADRDALAQVVLRMNAELSRLQDQFDRATIKAPFAGRIAAVHVEIGEWVGRGDQILSLLDLSGVEVAVQIAERYISAVQEGFGVDVQFDALPGRQYTGRLHAIIPEAVPEARTFPVLFRIANRDLAIKGGMAARINAQLGSPEPAVLVSKDAVVRRGNQVLLFRIDPAAMPGAPAGAALAEGSTGMITPVSVDLGPARGEWQVVYGPVAAGELFVVRGNERVFPGQAVMIANMRTAAIPTADPNRPMAVDPRQGGTQ
jgi:RND family efflux transporter MFP subunit